MVYILALIIAAHPLLLSISFIPQDFKQVVVNNIRKLFPVHLLFFSVFKLACQFLLM